MFFFALNGETNIEFGGVPRRVAPVVDFNGPRHLVASTTFDPTLLDRHGTRLFNTILVAAHGNSITFDFVPETRVKPSIVLDALGVSLCVLSKGLGVGTSVGHFVDRSLVEVIGMDRDILGAGVVFHHHISAFHFHL